MKETLNDVIEFLEKDNSTTKDCLQFDHEFLQSKKDKQAEQEALQFIKSLVVSECKCSTFSEAWNLYKMNHGIKF